MTCNFRESEIRFIKVSNDPTLGARFYNMAHEHDGFRVEHCINAREGRLLGFLVPILNPREAGLHL